MKVVIFTLGCKVNKCESDAIFEKLVSLGYEVSDKLEYADIYILNTCAVTNEAERKSRQAVARVRKLNPNAEIFVMGCASESNSEQFLKLENVKGVYGCQNKFDVLENFENQKNNSKSQKSAEVRQYVKIQDGCNNFCSYCLIPYLRGRSVSRSVEDIVEEIKNIKEAKEIVLTGIDMSDFKIDGKKALGTLIEKLSFFEGRIRIGSLEVGVVNQEFVSKIKKVKNLCPHFHLSLQSGCDSVLKRMNRHYTTSDYESAVNLLRQNFENCSITTDIIVGFPQESDQEFALCYDFAKKIGFSDIHIFPYSQRKGTVALRFGGFVDGDIVLKRVEKLTNLKKELQQNFLSSNYGKAHNLLIEKVENNIAYGYTENYIYCKTDKECKVGDIIFGTLDKNSGFFVPLNQKEDK